MGSDPVTPGIANYHGCHGDGEAWRDDWGWIVVCGIGCEGVIPARGHVMLSRSIGSQAGNYTWCLILLHTVSFTHPCDVTLYDDVTGGGGHWNVILSNGG